MAMQALVMPPFEFEPKDSSAQRWTKWISRFDNYLLAVDISDPKRQKAMLLHMVGEELYNIFQTLQVADPGINETVYDKAKAALVIILLLRGIWSLNFLHLDKHSKNKMRI